MHLISVILFEQQILRKCAERGSKVQLKGHLPCNSLSMKPLPGRHESDDRSKNLEELRDWLDKE